MVKQAYKKLRRMRKIPWYVQASSEKRKQLQQHAQIEKRVEAQLWAESADDSIKEEAQSQEGNDVQV